MKRFHRLLVKETYDMASAKEAGLGRKHEHPKQGFLVVGTVVGSRLIPLPVPVRTGHQMPFIGRVVMLQRAIAGKT